MKRDQPGIFVGVVAVLGVLAGCSTGQRAQKAQVIYRAPPPPKTFDLTVYPGKDDLFKVHGKGYDFRGLGIYIRARKVEKDGTYSVLYAGAGQGKDLLNYICFMMIVWDQRVAGYNESGGTINPVVLSNGEGGGAAIRYYWQKCRDR